MSINNLSEPGKWFTEFDENGNCTKVVYYPSYLALLGYCENEYEDRQESWAVSIHPEDEARVNAHLEECLKKHPEGMDYDIEYRMLTKNGYRWFHDYGLCTRRADGSVSRCDGVVFDIQDTVDKAEAYNEIQAHSRFLGAIPLSNDILTKANIGLWAFELDEGQPPRMYADEAMLGLIGLTEQRPPEETYHAWYDNIDEGSYPLVADAVNRMVAGEHAEVQYPWHHPDGHIMMVRCGGIRNPEYTKGIRIEGTHQNVTEVIHFQEDALKEAKEYRRLVDSFADNYDTVNILHPDDGTFTLIKSVMEKEDVNAGAGSFKDAIRYYIEKIVYEGDRELMRREADMGFIKQRSASEGSYTVEYRTQTGGRVLWNEMSVTYLNEKNVIVGFTEKNIQIITHHLQEMEQEDYYALFTIDLDTGLLTVLKRSDVYPMGQVGESCFAEDALKRFAGTQTGETRAFFLRLADLEHVKQVLLNESKRTYSYKSVLIGNRDRWVTVTTYAVLRHADNTPAVITVGFSLMDTLGADRQDMQNKLEDALSMAQSANRAKTTFLNNMSHDIRTPMNAIIGYTGLAAGHIDNKQQVKDYLSKIAQSSSHLLSLINDVLDMSRIESGKMNLEEKPESLSEIMHGLRDIVQSDIRSKQHDFFIDTVGVNDENVLCDKLRLNQVLLNVISNAIKYTAPGGIISMRITEKCVNSADYATYEFRIKDNGIGMDKEFIKKIFDPFTRVNSTTVSGIQGTGLGMAITKNIVDMMGGRIDIQSEPGKGTEVIITLDFKLQNRPSKPVVIPELKGLRSLVVDDDANTCLSVYGMLKEIGMRPEWCTGGREAVFRAQAAYNEGDSFKVYIIDWLMPDMNGIETVRRIRKAIGRETPIIILSSYDWSDIEDEAREAGVTAFVSKPMFPSDLNRVLRQCLGKDETAKAQKRDYDFRGKKLLLVEDNELNREIAQELLSEYGFEVYTVEDGDKAVEKMKAAKMGDYDAVLMDIQMPTLNGYDATRQIRALNTEISKIPILAMTANAFEEDRKLALTAGMNEHIAKPIDIEKLKATLAKYLGVEK